ncbi:AI-2E family transporter [Mariprofundus sp. EBB-1]|uniref:AI-2E family transporter n=1 Tax=Mariprofundus sp. EBB-1 TaxID=2650971 RepID=UPI000EF26DBB|nr:AI-2E family transporter [Mariprofundus sp. EBB-1]RLL51875.1 AI-2E family transporter [Mariprofundus sp. EBB-1]
MNKPAEGSASLLISSAAFVVVIAGMQAAASLLVPFLLAAFVAIICLPMLSWLIHKQVPAGLAVLCITLAIVLIGLLIAAFVSSSLADFSHNIPSYQERLKALTADALLWLSGMGLAVSSQSMLDVLDPSAAMGMAGKLLSGLGNALANTFLIVLTVIFLLIEASALPHKWSAMDENAPSKHGFETFISSVGAYFSIKTWISLATGIFIAIWLAVIGVDYPLLWGLVAFLFNFVPNIGSIIAAIPALLLALVQLGGGDALLAGLGYIIANVVMGNVIEPKFMGRGVGLSTLVVFISLVFWGWVLGPVGMLLSVPLTMIIKLALESRQETQWVAILLGPDIKQAEAKR